MRSDTESDVQAALAVAVGHVQQRRFSQARSLLLKILRNEPDLGVAGELMGMVSSELGRMTKHSNTFPGRYSPSRTKPGIS